ncbi:MAG: FAD-binding protein [Bacteroidales bacterium]|nr:FAD-binding protein [Bacteroidales bacterium]
MNFDVIIIGGGLAGMKAADILISKGRKVAVITEGHSIHNVSYKDFQNAGGTLLMGDSVASADVKDGKVLSITTANISDIPFTADNFILATGKYFGGGIKADMNHIWEPLFGCDIESDEDRNTWFDWDFDKKQRFLDFGVKVDDKGRVLSKGTPFENLYACGEILAGLSGVDEDADKKIEASAERVADIIADNTSDNTSNNTSDNTSDNTNNNTTK